MNLLANWLGKKLSAYLSRPGVLPSTSKPANLQMLQACIQPGDVLLVEGTSRVSRAIKYLTQSTWSHAALCVGNLPGQTDDQGQALCLIEADMVAGVRALPLAYFEGFHCRVCRPVSLRPEEISRVCAFAVASLGKQYDLRNLWDLARYLFPTPPVPQRWRRRMITLGSGDPTRAICSSLIAQAFEQVRYPILPKVEDVAVSSEKAQHFVKEIYHARHHSLYVPRDFDVSPYFAIVKPTLAAGFDHHNIDWASDSAFSLPDEPPPPPPSPARSS
jgi:Permuted papain-like amidase enzyme, YaeF/YiiX, C92 family